MYDVLLVAKRHRLDELADVLPYLAVHTHMIQAVYMKAGPNE